MGAGGRGAAGLEEGQCLEHAMGSMQPCRSGLCPPCTRWRQGECSNSAGAPPLLCVDLCRSRCWAGFTRHAAAHQPAALLAARPAKGEGPNKRGPNKRHERACLDLTVCFAARRVRSAQFDRVRPKPSPSPTQAASKPVRFYIVSGMLILHAAPTSNPHVHPLTCSSPAEQILKHLRGGGGERQIREGGRLRQWPWRERR